MRTRRRNLQNIRFSENFNASLWLDKFIEDATNSKDGGRMDFVKEVVKIKQPEFYDDYFHEIWKENLNSFGAKCRQAKVKNRLAINLGSESVLETNIALHRVFGVPFISGSSLKGLVSHFLHQYGDDNWRKKSDNHTVIFGDENNAGFITFYDALYVPNTGFPDKDGVKRPMFSDVMTVHHQEYYGSGNAPPADWDSPNPVPFISATGEYLIALSAPEGCEDWIELTFDIIGFALATEGIGAKTSSGYGRMWLKDENNQITDKYEIKASTEIDSTAIVDNTIPQNQTISENKRIADSFIQRINALRNTDVAGRIPAIAQDCLNIEDESAKKQVATAIKQKIVEANRENASKGRKWYEDIIPFTEDADWVVTTKS